MTKKDYEHQAMWLGNSLAELMLAYKRNNERFDPCKFIGKLSARAVREYESRREQEEENV